MFACALDVASDLTFPVQPRPQVALQVKHRACLGMFMLKNYWLIRNLNVTGVLSVHLLNPAAPAPGPLPRPCAVADQRLLLPFPCVLQSHCWAPPFLCCGATFYLSFPALVSSLIAPNFPDFHLDSSHSALSVSCRLALKKDSHVSFPVCF